MSRPSEVKVVFVCFACRVSLKRHKYLPLATPDARCPRCRGEMRFVGRYFKVPPRANSREWRKAEMLWRTGWQADGWGKSAPSMRTLRDAREIEARQSEARRKYLQWRRHEASREKWRRARRKKHP